MSKKDKKSGVTDILKYTFPKVYKAAPILFAAFCFFKFLGGLLDGAQALILQLFLDKATDLAVGGAVMADVLTSLAILTFALLFSAVVAFINSFLPQRLQQKANVLLSEEYYEKIGSLSPASFEDTKNLENLEKAVYGRNAALSLAIYTVCGLVFFSIPYFCFISWYLFSMAPILAIAIIIAFVPRCLSNIMFAKMGKKTEDELSPIRRRNSYYGNCIKSNKYFKETRLLGAFNYFMTLYKDTMHNIEDLKMKLNVKRNALMLMFNILSLIGYIVVLYILFELLLGGSISVGAFAAVYNAIGNIYSYMENLMGNTIYSMAEITPYASNFISVIKMPEYSGEDVAISQIHDICAENVSFSYPQSQRRAVSDVNFNIKGGETIAIVGENGSGKSTLIKLIIGFYRPEEGRIKYNGTSTQDMSFNSVAKRASAVFQRFAHYSMTLADNLVIGQIDKIPTESEMRRACEFSGFSPEDVWLPDGFDTMLSRHFGGVEISGGQIQRVAIARSFYRDCDIIILDEPTAAIDPFEEARIYNRFAQLSKGKTSFIVTHRLGSVKLADRIIVMKDGRVEEIGTHKELMENNGEYKRMYDSQSQWYKDTEYA